MQLAYLMLTGSLSGLASVLAYSVFWTGLELAGRREPSRADVSVADAFLHMSGGLVLGAMFWLSWGLPAIVGVPWWVRGACFALLCWCALSAPLVLELILARRLPRRDAGAAATRWAITCLIAGLACAWNFEEMF